MRDAQPGTIGADTLRKRVFSMPTLIATVVGAGLFAFALWRLFDFEWPELWQSIRSINPWLYLLAVAVYYLSFWFRGWRWRLIARTANLDGENGARVPGITRMGGIILMGWFANSVAFLRLGDAYRGWALSRETRTGFPASLGTVLAERVQDMAAVLVLVIIAAIWVTVDHRANIPGGVLIAAFALVGALIAGLLVMRFFGEKVSRFLPLRLQRAYLNFQAGTLGSFRSRDLPAQFALGVTGWMLEIGRFYLVAAALGIDMSFGVIMFAALANAMLTTIPTPGGFGFVEGGLAGLLILLGLRHPDALALTIVDRTISWLSVILFGGILFFAWHAYRAKVNGAGVVGSTTNPALPADARSTEAD